MLCGCQDTMEYYCPNCGAEFCQECFAELDNGKCDQLYDDGQHNLLLSKLDMTGDQNEFRSLTTCPTNYYRTQIFMPSIESGKNF